MPAGREALRKQVLEAEILRMAAERGNRITVIELVTELSLTAEMARGTLEDMLRRGLADIQVTDLGGIVYTFPDLDQLHDRSRSKGLLDA
jgi:predicted DNA-binding transcriptional regulator